MSEIDKFFKDKMEGRTFEFKDSYWEAAERMIEQEEDDRRKRAGIWWKFGIFFLFLFGIAGYFFIHPQDDASLSVTPLFNNENQASGTKPLQNNTTANDLLNSTTNSNIAIEEALAKQKETATSAATLKETAAEATGNASSGQAKNNNSTPSVNPLEGDLKVRIIKDHIKTEKTIDSKEFISPLTLDTLGNIPNANPLPMVPDSLKTKKLELALESTTKEEQPVIKSKTVLPTETEGISELALLETLAPELEMPEYDCEDCFDFEKVKYKRLKFGLSAENVIYPFEKGESWLVGGTMGLIANYSLGRRFAIRSGLQYSLTKGITDKDLYDDNFSFGRLSAFGDSDVIIQEVYGFGSRTVETLFPPSTIHSLEIPLLVQFRHKKNTIEAGVQLNFLTGIRGKEITRYSLFPWEDSQGSITVTPEAEQSVDKITTKKWLPLDTYKKLSNSLVLGYRYSLTSKLSIGLDAFYRMGGTTSRNSVALNSNVVFGESYTNKFSRERLHFRLGVNWYL